MRILPSDHLILKSQLSPDEFRERLSRKVSKERFFTLQFGFFSIPPHKTPFYRKIEGDKFKIRRALNYNNSFQPILHGEFQADDDGTRLSAELKMYWHVRAFVLFFIVCCSLIGISFLFVPAEEFEGPYSPISVSAFIFAFAVLILALVSGGFYFGGNKTREALAEDLMVTDIWQGRNLDEASVYL